MRSRTEKIVLLILTLVITAGYFTGSWFIVQYGLENNNNLLALSPLMAFISLIFGLLVALAFRNLCGQPRELNSPLSTQYT